MEYGVDMDIYRYRGIFLFLMEYDMDIEEFSCFQWIKYGYEGVFLFLMEYDMDIEEFSCF